MVDDAPETTTQAAAIALVHKAYPSARVEKRGFSYFVKAWVTLPAGRRDLLLGMGRMHESAAWLDASRNLFEGRPRMPETTEAWRPISTAPDRVTVMTRLLHPCHGARNEGPLRRDGRLWFLPDGSMYVYYTPTHWKPL